MHKNTLKKTLIKIFLCLIITCLIKNTQADYINNDEVFIDIQGGLGNNMFQYATGYAYAKRHGKTLKIETRIKHLSNTFDIPISITFNQRKTLRKIAFIESHQNSLFENEMLNPKYQYLIGFFQNENYFKEYRSDILKEFQFKKPLEGENKKLALEIQKKNSIAVHIRRGDYLREAKNDILSNHYYLLAMDYMASKINNPHFYIFSDDITWVEKNLKVKYNHSFVKNNQGTTTSNDMHLMSLCKHQIIANSTFSWWGAWLNQNPDKIIIAPNIWLTNRNAYKITKNIIPDDWIRIQEKANIAIIFLNEKDKNIQKENFNKFFLPFDRKTYFTKNEIDKLNLEKFDYIFIIASSFILNKEINYSIVPYNQDILFFVYKTRFEQTDNDHKKINMIAIKHINTLKDLKEKIKSLSNE